MKNRRAFVAVLSCCVLPAVLAGQGRTSGQKILAKPGDLIVVENTDRVRIVRRRDAQVRTIYSRPQQWLVVLVDYASAGADPDGRVDVSLRYEQIVGDWPLGDRWEGRTAIDEYSLAGEAGFYGIGFSAPGGLVQVVGPGEGTTFRDPAAAAAVTFRRSGRGGSGLPFDIAENQQLMALSGAAATQAAGPRTAGQGPVRVGGTIRPPAKLQDVRPVYPEAALANRVSGLVILEATIGTDGTVTDAKVLRSIPLLDEAAVTAVRQWRFEPTLLNGVPVAVIMTVTVSFNVQ